MAIIKTGITCHPLTILKMVFACSSCENTEIIGAENYDPNIEKKCSKCQKTMVLFSTNSEDFPSTMNRGGDSFTSNKE